MNTNAEDEKLVRELAFMSMHSTRETENLMIQRVPGGWNYIYKDQLTILAVVFIAMPKSFMGQF